MAKDDQDEERMDSSSQTADSLFTEDKLAFLRKAGYPKPPEVSWSDWMGPKKLGIKHEVIAYHAISGKNARQIAQELGINEQRLSIILNTSRMKARMTELRQQVYGTTIQSEFHSRLPKALGAIDSVLDSPNSKDNMKLKAANEIFNRALGRPKETIELRSSSAKDIFEYLDRKKAEQKSLDQLQSVEQPPKLNSVNNVIETELVVPKGPTGVLLKPDEQDTEIDEWMARNLSRFSDGD